MTLNINGLMNKDKFHKMYQNFICEGLDFIMLQEVKNVIDLKGLNAEKYVVYKLDEIPGRNGTMVMYDCLKFDCEIVHNTSQFQIIKLHDVKSDTEILILNIYLNPSPDKKDVNLEILLKLEDIIITSRRNNINLIMGGDMNHF